MKIRIVTSCTGKKRYKPQERLEYRDFVGDADHLKLREEDLSEYRLPAGEMYTGQQHARLMRGVEYVRSGPPPRIHVDLYVVSAGYGLVHEKHPIVPYECTFNTLSSNESRKLILRTGVVESFRRLVAEPSDCTLVLLGNTYLRLLDISPYLTFGGRTIFLSGDRAAKRLRSIKGVEAIALSNENARQFSCGMVGLKGEVAARMLKAMSLDRTMIENLTAGSSSALKNLVDITVEY